MEIKQFNPMQSSSLIQLWHECGLVRPWNDPQKDIDRKLRDGHELFLMGLVENRIMASIMGGYDGHRGWMNYLAVAPAHRGCGHARTLVARLEAELLARGCPKLNLQIRTSNTEVIAFYRYLGFELDEAVSMGKRLIPDD